MFKFLLRYFAEQKIPLEKFILAKNPKCTADIERFEREFWLRYYGVV